MVFVLCIALPCPRTEGGVQVAFANGDSCPPNRAVTYQFACNPAATTPTYVVNTIPGVTCQYTAVIQTQLACGGPAPNPPAPPTPAINAGVFPTEILSLIPTPPAPCFNTSELMDLARSPDMIDRRADGLLAVCRMSVSVCVSVARARWFSQFHVLTRCHIYCCWCGVVW